MERLYQDLSQAVKQVPKGDMLLVMGDFNAKDGTEEPSAMSSVVRLHGLEETNEAGEKLEDSCLENIQWCIAKNGGGYMEKEIPGSSSR